jgi:hypothetical protein
MLKKIIGIIVLALFFQQIVIAQNNSKPANLTNNSTSNPLITFSKEWDMPIYKKCNTAKGLTYLSATEKEVIWILNMCRLNPKLFLNSVLLNPKSSAYKKSIERTSYYNSLIEDLKTLAPNQRALLPDTNLFVSANCHAYESGKIGIIGHERVSKKCPGDYLGECCSYGYVNPADIVITLLIDEGIENLGHRNIMLSKKYTLIGVSKQPHISKFGTNTVMDFK